MQIVVSFIATGGQCYFCSCFGGVSCIVTGRAVIFLVLFWKMDRKIGGQSDIIMSHIQGMGTK